MGNQFIYRYVVPPGGDAINHNPYVIAILEGRLTEVGNYHILWHLIVAIVAFFTRLPSITVMAWLGPLLLFTGGISLFWFMRRYFGLIAALATVIAIGFFSNQPLQTLYDGGFPNVLAAGTVLPFIFIAAERMISDSNKLKASILLTLTLFILSYSHHIVTLYTLTALGIFYLIQCELWLRKKRVNPILIMTGLIAIISGGIGVAGYLLHSLQYSIASLARAFVDINLTPPFIHLIGQLDNPNAMWPLKVYPNAIGETIVYLGLLGSLIAIYLAIKERHNPKGRISLLIIILALVLLLGSQTPALTFPVRLARDLAIPLAMLAGIFVGEVLDYMAKKQAPLIFHYAVVILCLAVGLATGLSRFQRMTQPNPLVSHLKVDIQATNYITTSVPLSSTILTFNDNTHQPLFDPLHKFLHISNPNILRQLTEANTIYLGLKNVDYVYLEYRTDREETWINNRGMLEKYKSSPYFEPLAQEFVQPEKTIILLKVNRRMIPS